MSLEQQNISDVARAKVLWYISHYGMICSINVNILLQMQSVFLSIYHNVFNISAAVCTVITQKITNHHHKEDAVIDLNHINLGF